MEKGEKEVNKLRKSRFFKPTAVLALAAGILALQGAGIFYGTDMRIRDYRYQRGGLINPDIYVIGIDEETLIRYGSWQNFSRAGTARLLEQLNGDPDLAPAVIGLDIGFFGETKGEADRALADGAALLDNVVTTSYATFGKAVSEANGTFSVREQVMTYEEPYEALRENVTWGFSNVPLDTDGIVRHTMGYMEAEGEKVYSFSAEVYRKYMGELPSLVLHGNGLCYIPFSGKPYDYYGSETAGLSFAAVAEGEIPRELFAGAIVLVGPYSTGMMDSYYTAVDHAVPMYGVEVHANILQAMLEGNHKRELSLWAETAITGVFLALMAGALNVKAGERAKKDSGKEKSKRNLKNIHQGRMKRAVLAAVLLVGGYWWISGLAYEKGLVLPLLYPLGAVVLSLIFYVAGSYVQERQAKKNLERIFGKYVSGPVVSNILKQGEEALKLGGQKKDIAVLFVDIRGFTPLSEALPPEKVVEILNQYLELTTSAVFGNEGTVDKFIGDATMAIYNAPMDLDDYVYRAVKTGLDMVEGAKKLEKRLGEITEKKVGFGIGVNCGEAVIGNIGTSRRMDYTAIGNTVNTAARLESQALAGQVLVSREVYERVKDRFRFKYLGTRKLKGLAEEAPVYLVEGIL